MNIFTGVFLSPEIYMVGSLVGRLSENTNFHCVKNVAGCLSVYTGPIVNEGQRRAWFLLDPHLLNMMYVRMEVT